MGKRVLGLESHMEKGDTMEERVAAKAQGCNKMEVAMERSFLDRGPLTIAVVVTSMFNAHCFRERAFVCVQCEHIIADCDICCIIAQFIVPVDHLGICPT